MVKRKLLVVDELSAARKLVERLAGLGYHAPVVAESEDDAIALTARSTPDLVLMRAPSRGDANSVRIADALQHHGRIPVVFMIAKPDEAVPRRAGSAEQHAYLVIPFTNAELRAAIDLALCKDDAETAVDELSDSFFAASIDMLCFLDFNGRFKRLNPAWERTLGFTLEELKSRPFIEFVHPDDRERTLQQNAQVREGGQAVAFENRYLCKDGSHRWFHWNAVPDAVGKVIYSVARDVTASKLAEEERERLVRELQAALAEVKMLRAILPMCSYCRKIRDDENSWHSVEHYIVRHTKSRFSHGICPSCMTTVVEPQLAELEREDAG